MIGALVAGILVLVIIGTGRFFERKVIIETYFKESVQGLDIGSKLKYRGVTIGEVTQDQLHVHATTSSTCRSRSASAT